jgi:hypothetical protein
MSSATRRAGMIEAVVFGSGSAQGDPAPGGGTEGVQTGTSLPPSTLLQVSARTEPTTCYFSEAYFAAGHQA